MTNQGWKIDGESFASTAKASVIWEDAHFFTLLVADKQFHGEIVENGMEQGFLKVKINHREFVIQKERALDSLIAELGLDKVEELILGLS